MRPRSLFCWMALWEITLAFGNAITAQPPSAPQRIRIGVDVRLGLQACIDYWTPVTQHLSKAIPEYRFVVVPLASQGDLSRVLAAGGVEFMALDPAMQLAAEDRYGAIPLATMTENAPGQTPPSPDAACSAALIRRADRSDLRDIDDLRGRRVAAVKPWSLTGWIAPWGLLTRSGIDPHRDLKQVAFEGVQGQVVRRVLDGSADAGAVDAELLAMMLGNGRIAPNALYVMNREGRAVPLTPDPPIASTTAYPGRMFSKAAAVSDALAKRVTDALIGKTLDTTLDGMPCQVRWTAPCNTSKVRRLLQTLMGPQFAESKGFPLPPQRPAWLFPVQVFGIALAVVFLAAAAMRRYYFKRDALLDNQLVDTREELIAVRAELQRINAIMALAGCGIDIVDSDNQLIYANSSLQRRYGDWHGLKCYEYFCGADGPCPQCTRPFPINERCPTTLDLDCSEWTTNPIALAEHPKVEGQSERMIGVPFRDEGGRWLYARIHFPLMQDPALETVAADLQRQG